MLHCRWPLFLPASRYSFNTPKCTISYMRSRKTEPSTTLLKFCHAPWPSCCQSQAQGPLPTLAAGFTGARMSKLCSFATAYTKISFFFFFLFFFFIYRNLHVHRRRPAVQDRMKPHDWFHAWLLDMHDTI